MSEDGLKKIISHAKEYGFVFPSSEIYDGLSAAYDYGQLGSELGDHPGRPDGPQRGQAPDAAPFRQSPEDENV